MNMNQLPYLASLPDFENPANVALYDELTFWSARFGSLLLDHLTLAPDLSILDVACGTGFPTFELAQLSGDSCQVTGVDLWDAALDRARRKQALYGVHNVRFLRADAAALPLPDRSFDLIVSNLGLNNFERPQQVLAECARVANPAARLLLTTNVVGHMAEVYEAFRQVLVERADTASLELLAAQEAHRGTRDSVRALVHDAGFVVTRLVEDSFSLRYLDGSAFLRHYFVRLGFLPGWRSVVDPAGETVVFAALEARLNAIARERGELRLTIPMLLMEARRAATADHTPPE